MGRERATAGPSRVTLDFALHACVQESKRPLFLHGIPCRLLEVLNEAFGATYCHVDLTGPLKPFVADQGAHRSLYVAFDLVDDLAHGCSRFNSNALHGSLETDWYARAPDPLDCKFGAALAVDSVAVGVSNGPGGGT